MTPGNSAGKAVPASTSTSNTTVKSPAPQVHHPALDGLRAVAVVAVVVYHFTAINRPTLWQGGFLGVDLFFVLSGFLITGLLLAEHTSTARLDLPGFWRRRFRRLFPAFMVFLVLIALVAITSPRSAVFGVSGDAIWSLLSVQNWHALYWDPATNTPLSHTWSLSVEEQWYLVWPAVLWGILWLTKGRRRTVLLVALGVAAMSAIWTAVLFGHDGWLRAYYGTDGRAQELLLGAGLALLASSGRRLESSVARVVLEGVGWLAVLFLGTAVAFGRISDSFFYEGGFFLVAVAAVLIIAAALYSNGPLGKILSWRPLVVLGLISYGVYLFHIPVLYLVEPGRWGLEGGWLFVVRAVVTLSVAGLSYILIENPVRRQRLRLAEPRVWIPGAAVCALTLSVILVAGNVPQPSEFTAAGDAARGTPVRVMVIGELPVVSLVPITAFGYATKKISIVSYGFLGCGFSSGNIFAGGARYVPSAECTRWPSALRKVVPAFSPTVVALVVGNQEIFDRSSHGVTYPAGSKGWAALMTTGLATAQSIAQHNGARVVIVPSTCPNAWATLPALEPENADPTRFAMADAALAQFATARHLKVWHLDHLLCPAGKPLRSTDGSVISTVRGGLTREGSLLTWQWLARQAIKTPTSGSA